MTQQYDPDLVDEIIRYENGQTENIEEEAALFQKLINSGMVWNLQGSYQRRAIQLINAGFCHVEKPIVIRAEKQLPIGLSPEEGWLEAALHIGRNVGHFAENTLAFGENDASAIRAVCYRIIGGAGVDTHDPVTRRRLNGLINRAIDQAWWESPAWPKPSPIKGA
jgi:hypothetical protein